MLGSLARKLRALGFGAEYQRSGDEREFMAAAARHGMVILTSDRTLAAQAGRKGLTAVLLRGKTAGARLGVVMRGVALSRARLVRGAPLCSVCGGELKLLDRDEARGKVPPSVVLRHRKFFECLSCGKVYWKGSHWKKLRSHERRLKEFQHADFKR